METIYRYAWLNDNSGHDITDYSAYIPKRPNLYGRECRVLARGRMNSCLVEFVDTGLKEIISRNALRKIRSDLKEKQ